MSLAVHASGYSLVITATYHNSRGHGVFARSLQSESLPGFVCSFDNGLHERGTLISIHSRASNAVHAAGLV